MNALGDAYQHLLLAIDERGCVVAGNLKAMAVSNLVRGAGLDAETTKDAAVIVDVINLGVALASAAAQLRGVLGGLDINTISGTRRGAQEARYTFFQTVLVSLQLVHAAETFLELRRRLGIVFREGRLQHFLECDAKAFC